MNKLALATPNINLSDSKKSLFNKLLIVSGIGLSIIILIAVLFFPDIAYAGAWEDFAANPFGFICIFVFGSLNKMFCEIINGAYFAMMKYINGQRSSKEWRKHDNSIWKKSKSS